MLVWSSAPLLRQQRNPQIPPVGDDPPVQNHPAIEVFASFEANGNNTAVAVLVARLADDCCAPDPIGQGKACPLAAAPDLARSLRTELAALGRIDAANPRPVYGWFAGALGLRLSMSTSALALRGFAKPLEGRKP